MALEIFQYEDSNAYLRDYFVQQKRSNPKYSYRFLSKTWGFSSPNYLKLVFDGKRNLSLTSAIRIAEHLKLDPKEREYFEGLVQLKLAKNERESKHIQLRLKQLKSVKSVNRLSHAQFRYLTKWYYPVIREMTQIRHFNATPSVLAKTLSPQITVREAKEALETLVELGLLKQVGSRYEPTSGRLTTDPDVLHKAARVFHESAIHNALGALDRTPFNQRNFTSAIFAINQKSFTQIKKMIQNFYEELYMTLGKEKSPDAIYQINLQLFNLTKVTW